MGLSLHPHTLTDSHEILHTWLHPPYLPTCHIWSSQDRHRCYFSSYSQSYHSVFFSLYAKSFYRPRDQAVEPILTRDTPFRGGGSRRIIPISFGTEKSKMVWLRDGEKKSKISLFVLTECTNVTDTQGFRLRPNANLRPQKVFNTWKFWGTDVSKRPEFSRFTKRLNSGRLLTSVPQNFHVLNTFCGRKFAFGRTAIATRYMCWFKVVQSCLKSYLQTPYTQTTRYTMAYLFIDNSDTKTWQS